MSEKSGIARSTGVLTLATGASRILGFVRDLFIAGLFGTGLQAQAFVVAFRLPNLLRDLVAEGAVTSAFVPVLSAHRVQAPEQDFWVLSQTLLTRLCIVVCGLGIAGVLAAPWIVRLIAPGFMDDPEKFALTVRLTRWLFPLITLVGLWAYFMGLLNSLRHFAAPALGPAILNASMIAACIWLVPRWQPGILGLAWGVLVGAAAQLLIQIPVAMRRGFRWRWHWRHPRTSEILRLMGPRTLGAAAYQVSVVVQTVLASLESIVGVGAVAALYFANRLVQLPLALFATASAQASLPTLSEQAARADLRGFHDTLLSILRMVAFVILPSSIGLMVLGAPIVGGLFERGAFGLHSTLMTSKALVGFSVGLLAYSVTKVLTGAFYALQDTWTPVKLAIEAVAVNIVLSLLLMGPLHIVGLALAAAAANILNAARLLRQMERRLHAPLLKPLSAPLGRMLIASGVMGGGCWLLWRGVAPLLPSLWALAVVILAGLGLYSVACRVIRVPEFSTVVQWFGQRPIVERFLSE